MRRIYLAIAIVALASVNLLAEADKSAAEKPVSDLDQQLLEGLGDLFDEDLQKPKPAQQPEPDAEEPASAEPAGKQSEPEPSELDKQLLEGLLDGDDLGASDDPLVRIGQQMRKAGTLIGETNSGRPTQQLQQRAIADLEALIKLARQKQQSQSQSSSSQQQSRREQVKQPGRSSTASRDQSNQPARDSTSQMGNSQTQKPDMAQMREMIQKDIWGQLPEKVREQMMQNQVDQFLPKYELLIEEYFKTLAERQKQNP